MYSRAVPPWPGPGLDGNACERCLESLYSPGGKTCQHCPENSKPGRTGLSGEDHTYCRCTEGYYYDHWTPGLQKDEVCRECVGDVLCRTLSGNGSTAVTLVAGVGDEAKKRAAGFWIHTESMHALHCMPGNCISCDDAAGQNRSDGQTLNSLLPSALMRIVHSGGDMKGNQANITVRRTWGPPFDANCTGDSPSCLSWQQQVVGTCCR